VAKQLFQNNVTATLGAPLAAGALSITLVAGHGITLNPTGGDYFVLTLSDPLATETKYERVKITARADDVLTVPAGGRGFEGTDQAWATGDRAEMRIGAHELGRWSGTTAFENGLSLGTTPALTGALRLSPNEWIASRNVGGTADKNLLRLRSLTGPDRDFLEPGIDIYRDSTGTYDSRDAYLSFQRSMNTPLATSGAGSFRSLIDIRAHVEHSGTVAMHNRGIAIYQFDHPDVVNKTITNAVNNGSGLIRITATGHTFVTGDRVAIYGVVGTTEANNTWLVTTIDANTFDLQGSTFTNAYVSGGTVTNRGTFYSVAITVNPTLSRDGMSGAVANGDDLNGVVGYNEGPGKATDFVYLGHNEGDFPGSAREWATGVTIRANCDVALAVNGNNGYGLRFSSGGTNADGIAFEGTITDAAIDMGAATLSTGVAMRLPTGRMAADGTLTIGATGAPAFQNGGTRGIHILTTDGSFAEVHVQGTGNSSSVAFEATGKTAGGTAIRGRLAVDGTGNTVRLGSQTSHTLQILYGGSTKLALDANLTVTDTVNFVFSGTTGSKLGTATSQKIGFWNATPVVQQTVTGDRFGSAVLQSALAALAAEGLIVDSTTDSGAVIITKALSADQSNSTVTPTEVTGLSVAGLQPGTYTFEYFVRYQSAAATTGVKFDVNFTGTVTSFVWNQRWVTALSTAADANPDQDVVTATGGIVASFASRAKGTAGRGVMLGVDTAAADLLMVIEGLMVVTVAGDLELWHGSEVAAQSTVKAGSSLVLTKTG
jgi:hypothetical protein